jgi:hypothetical protein
MELWKIVDHRVIVHLFCFDNDIVFNYILIFYVYINFNLFLLILLKWEYKFFLIFSKLYKRNLS